MVAVGSALAADVPVNLDPAAIAAAEEISNAKRLGLNVLKSFGQFQYKDGEKWKWKNKFSFKKADQIDIMIVNEATIIAINGIPKYRFPVWVKKGKTYSPREDKVLAGLRKQKRKSSLILIFEDGETKERKFPYFKITTVKMDARYYHWASPFRNRKAIKDKWRFFTIKPTTAMK